MLCLHHEGLFVGVFALALINTAIGQLQGRSAWSWFFTSLLLGPIATLLLVVTYKNKITI